MLFRRLRVHAFCLAIILLMPATPRARAQRVTPLASPPDWGRLQAYDGSLTAAQFVRWLDDVYAPGHAGQAWIHPQADAVMIRANATQNVMLTLAGAGQTPRPVPRYWKPLPRPAADPDHPLAGVSIAIDPGHLGGDFARMEERWFQFEGAEPIREGDLTLRVAQVLAPQLERLGARVVLVRPGPGPLTELRPESLQSAARDLLHEENHGSGGSGIMPTYQGPADPLREHSVEWQAERLFYRVAEIHERARRVNEVIRPDLVICVHFNAEPWGDPDHPSLVNANHLHLLVNGAYSTPELAYDDVRFEMLLKLLGQTHPEELALAESVARALAQATGLPPYQYHSPNAIPAGTSGYVWARNLLANRLYECPVIYTECYVMNSRSFFDRFQAGEYEGWRWFDNAWHQDIYQEYAGGIAEGLRRYCEGR